MAQVWYCIYMLRSHKKLPSKEYAVILGLRTMGNFLILTSLFFIGKTFYLPVSAEYKYYTDKQKKKIYIVATAQEGKLMEGAENTNVEVLVPIDPEFSIVIPKIAANAKILPNIDAADKDAYLAALQQGVAHADGTTFPGEHGHIFLFAHSTDYIWNVGSYNAVFYLLYKLEPGDDVNMFFKGQRYIYKVTGKEIVDPSQVEYLTRKTDKEFLTLQTCWPPGTTLKRMLIFAERVAE